MTLDVIVPICPDDSEVHLLSDAPPQKNNLPPPTLRTTIFIPQGRSFGYPFQITFQIGGCNISPSDQEIALRI